MALENKSRFSQFDEISSRQAPTAPKRKLQQTQQNFLHLAQYDPHVIQGYSGRDTYIPRNDFLE